MPSHIRTGSKASSSILQLCPSLPYASSVFVARRAFFRWPPQGGAASVRFVASCLYGARTKFSLTGREAHDFPFPRPICWPLPSDNGCLTWIEGPGCGMRDHDRRRPLFEPGSFCSANRASAVLPPFLGRFPDRSSSIALGLLLSILLSITF